MHGKEFTVNVQNKLFNEFPYSKHFVRIVDQNLTDLDPWGIILGSDLSKRYEGIKVRYPSRALVPFARRWDNDDVACFDANNPEVVHIIHDYASEGWEQRRSYDSFWEWFRQAIEDLIQFDA